MEGKNESSHTKFVGVFTTFHSLTTMSRVLYEDILPQNISGFL
jgi:hypothetical protein